MSERDMELAARVPTNLFWTADDGAHENIPVGRILADLRARVAELEGKARAVLSANDDFRAGMPANWEGDPLQDACADLRSILTETAPPLRDVFCWKHGPLTERCNTCDCEHSR